mmetsp:Transcript_19934/g.29028  ORF Transcript_19934/g.29028 Transcript_19934/m.29028 type:complete len:82 (+) Transcript_19934:320-565(+)
MISNFKIATEKYWSRKKARPRLPTYHRQYKESLIKTRSACEAKGSSRPATQLVTERLELASLQRMLSLFDAFPRSQLLLNY